MILYNEKLAVRCAEALIKISANQTYDIKKTYQSWYPGYKAIYSAMPAGRIIIVFLSDASDHLKDLTMICFATEGTFHQKEYCKLQDVDGRHEKKMVGEDSNNLDGRSGKRARIELPAEATNHGAPNMHCELFLENFLSKLQNRLFQFIVFSFLPIQIYWE
jgi:hypothetical protein